MFTPLETEFAMGWPVLDIGVSRTYSKCLPPSMQTFMSTSARERSTRSGNAMMLCQVYAWSLYVFSNIVRRRELEALMPSLTYKRPPKRMLADDTEAQAERDKSKM